MPKELIMALRPNGGKDYWRVQNVPTIYSTYWRDRGWDVYPIETFGEIESDTDHSSALRTLQLPTLWK
ncbi:disease resistance protein, partial [Trifolium medium]|nr:disease resistance protein [Trifolium medium]